MELILKQDVAGLGYKNDIVTVKAGYGRNYLIPNGYALIANDSNRRQITENVRQMAHKAAKLKQDAEALAARVGDFVAEMADDDHRLDRRALGQRDHGMKVTKHRLDGE